MFALSSQITIGNFQFSGVNEVHINRSIHSLKETAIIKIPYLARLLKKNKVIQGLVNSGSLFKDGDAVTIQLGYNGNMNTEFQGFVTKRSMDMPVEISCEGSSWLLHQNKISNFWQTVSLKELLQTATGNLNSGYSISVICDTDINFCNVEANNISGYRLINDILKYTDNTLCCFFISPQVLWCGLAYSAYAQNKTLSANEQPVSFRLGFNALNDNNLKVCHSSYEPLQVIYTKRLPTKLVLTAVSDVTTAPNHTVMKVLNHITDIASLQLLANEKAYLNNYNGYEGSFCGFLQPAINIGASTYLINNHYPDLNATYLLESSEVVFGMQGARRIMELGPRLAS